MASTTTDTLYQIHASTAVWIMDSSTVMRSESPVSLEEEFQTNDCPDLATSSASTTSRDTRNSGSSTAQTPAEPALVATKPAPVRPNIRPLQTKASSVPDIGNVIVRSLSNLFRRSTQSGMSRSCPRVPRLAEKYGCYMKPDKRPSQTQQAMGATSRKNIGTGATAVIRLVKTPDHQIYAVKEFKKARKNEKEREYIKRMHSEFCISKTASGHPNIVTTLDLVQDEQNRWCTVMEYCAGGDLFSLMAARATMSDIELACLFKQLLLGLQHLHEMGVAHRDIKPENLILTPGGTLKIADFGAADVVQSCFERKPRPSRDFCGSTDFWAPEIWRLKFRDEGYDGQALDVWSAGVTYYSMVHDGRMPFTVAFCHQQRGVIRGLSDSDPNSPSALAALDDGDESFALYCLERNELGPTKCSLWKTDKKLTEMQIKCLAGMLDPDPVTRWTVARILELPWMQTVEMCNDGALSNGWRHYHCLPTAPLC